MKLNSDHVFIDNVKLVLTLLLLYFSDARCVTLSDDKNEGLMIIRDDPESVLVPYRDNVTITCASGGRQLRNTVTSSFRQCVYDPKPVI